MKFTFACKKIALNDSIKEYAEKKISKLDRYFPEEADAFVTFGRRRRTPTGICGAPLTRRWPSSTAVSARTRPGWPGICAPTL